MSQDAVASIREAESRVDQILADARAKAREIVAGASDEADKISAKLISDSREKAMLLENEGRIRGLAAAEKITAAAENDCLALKMQAALGMNGAAALIIERVVNA